MADAFATMTAAAGPSVGIGNYKGVMLCNRPFAGAVTAARAAGKAEGTVPSFLCGKVPREIGLPAPRAANRGNDTQKPKRLNALIKHKRWLKDLQKAKDRLGTELLQQQSEKEESRKRFMAREAKMRQAMMEEFDKQVPAKESEDTDELLRDFQAELKQVMQEQPVAEDKAEGAARQEPSEQPETSEQPEGKEAECTERSDDQSKADKKRQSRPMWALTKQQAKTEEKRMEDEDAEELLDFVANLDFEAYLRDAEIAALLAGVKSRIKKIEEEGEKGELEELKQLNHEQRRLEERQRAQAEFAAKLAIDQQAQADVKPENGDSLQVAKALLTEEKDLGRIHSEKSLAVVADRSGERLDAQTVEEWETSGEPKIVTYTQDNGSRLEHKKDPSYLPYMHRNPAV